MRDKREKFKSLAEKRVNNALKNIQLIGNLSNTGNYDYSHDDVVRIFKSLRKEIQVAESRGTVTEKKKKFKL